MSIYGGSANLDKSDKIFDEASSFNIPGYIAMLQKYIASSGTCVLTVGGGTFQETARRMHSIYHPSGPRCALTPPNC